MPNYKKREENNYFVLRQRNSSLSGSAIYLSSRRRERDRKRGREGERERERKRDRDRKRGRERDRDRERERERERETLPTLHPFLASAIKSPELVL